MQTQEATARPFLVFGDDGAQIGLANENGQSQKLRLNIRRHNIEMELVKMHLPHDVKELMHLALEERRRGLEGRYNLVCIWVRAKNKGEFWRKFDCRTLDQLLARLELPNGKTIAMWEVLVRLFDKETFLLVGDEVLEYMTTLVSKYQKGAKQGLVAYQEIFDAYCAKHEAFDKNSFYKIVYWYVNTKYVSPKEKQAAAGGGRSTTSHSLDRDPYRRPAGEPSPGRGPQEAREDNQKCPHCENRKFVIKIAKEHVLRLETVIEQNLGKGYIPPRPKVLDWD